MSQFGQARFIEILSTARVRTQHEQLGIVITVRPQPDRSWKPHNLGVTWSQAERLRDDLTELLKSLPTFLLVAVLALNSGCSAKVVHESTTTGQAVADSVLTAPPSGPMENARTAVEINLLDQPATEPAAPQVPSVKQATPPKPVPVNTSGIRVNGDKNTIEFHYH